MLSELHSLSLNFLEKYGWFVVFGACLIYVIYKKYIYDFLERKRKEKELVERKKYDQDLAEKYSEKMRMARIRQQEYHSKLEMEEIAKREEKEKERLEKLLQESSVLDVAVGKFEKRSVKVIQKEEKKSAEEILDVLIASKTIVVFTKSFCPFSRKVRQLIATYRLSSDLYEFFDLDDDSGNLPAEEIQEIFEKKYGRRSVPKMFVNGRFIGGFEEIMEFSKNRNSLVDLQYFS